MKNKYSVLIILLLMFGCSSIDEEESEPAEVILYKLAQDRINANNFVGAVESLSRIERFFQI